jgi:phenylalanyl-tRNA synthetase beta chain
LHPGQSAKILLGDKEMGYIGALHPALEQDLGISGPIYLFEIFLDPICVTALPQFKALSKFPSIRRDLALSVNKDVNAQAIYNQITQVCGELLKDCWVFDVYEGPGIAADQKSLAFALVLQHQDRTLVDEEVNILLTKVMTALQQNLGVVLRE